MRIRFDVGDRVYTCFGALGCFVLSFLFTENAHIWAEIIRLFCVGAIGLAFYLHQSARINELQAELDSQATSRSRTQEEKWLDGRM